MLYSLDRQKRREEGVDRTQILSYVRWLLELGEVGQFLTEFVTNNSLLPAYIGQGLPVTVQLLVGMKLEDLPFPHLLLMSELTHKVKTHHEQNPHHQPSA